MSKTVFLLLQLAKGGSFPKRHLLLVSNYLALKPCSRKNPLVHTREWTQFECFIIISFFFVKQNKTGVAHVIKLLFFTNEIVSTLSAIANAPWNKVYINIMWTPDWEYLTLFLPLCCCLGIYLEIDWLLWCVIHRSLSEWHQNNKVFIGCPFKWLNVCTSELCNKRKTNCLYTLGRERQLKSELGTAYCAYTFQYKLI